MVKCQLQKYKCTLAYDGTCYAGFQIQPGASTIQGEVERVLGKIHQGKQVKITASGRTDAGVHAKGQVFHFQSDLAIPEASWLKALNSQLPKDIRLCAVEKVDADFHARFAAQKKEYRYFVRLHTLEDPFRRLYSYHFPYPVDLTRVDHVLPVLQGEHDFTAFCSSKTEVEDKVRQLFHVDYQLCGEELVFRFVGNGFLYNMVRILVGTLLEVGQGKREVWQVEKALQTGDRSLAGKTAPAQGLFLWEVTY